MLNRNFFLFICLGSLIAFSCKREEVTNKTVKKTTVEDVNYVFGLNDVIIRQDGANKPNIKSTTEFISIAYSDLFGTTISQSELVELGLAYVSFADKKLIEDLIIRNFLNKSGVNIPSSSEMTANPEQFAIDAYKKFYNREPNEFEKWQVVKLINDDQSTTPELIYYAFLTSNEYRYY